MKPDTILRWHRQGFRLFWRWKSSRPKVGKQRVADNVIALIRQMADQNRLWGAERIRGELLKLGIRVAKRTLQRYIRAARRPNSPRGQSWETFLCNHTVWACDFLQVYDIWFRPLFALFFVDIHSREVIHVATTRAPTEQWTAPYPMLPPSLRSGEHGAQLRNIAPFGHGPEVIIRDRDQKYGKTFDRVAEGAGIEVFVTAPRTPTMNATCERFLGSARRECLDHIIILGERHLPHALKAYCFPYFNTCRPHQGIRQRIPVPMSRAVCDDTAKVVAVPVLNGLHHDYQLAA